MNKEQLRLKLIESWSKGNIEVDLDDGFWGFRNIGTDMFLEKYFGITAAQFYSEEFDKVAYSVAVEISNYPLVKALA